MTAQQCTPPLSINSLRSIAHIVEAYSFREREKMGSNPKRRTVMKVGADGVAVITIINPPVNSLSLDGKDFSPFGCMMNLSVYLYIRSHQYFDGGWFLLLIRNCLLLLYLVAEFGLICLKFWDCWLCVCIVLVYFYQCNRCCFSYSWINCRELLQISRGMSVLLPPPPRKFVGSWQRELKKLHFSEKKFELFVTSFG